LGSESAFRELVAAYQDKVYNTVLGFVQQEDDARDLTQDVFIKVWQSIKTFRHDAALGTWIYRIAVSKSLDQLRKNKRKAGGLLGLFGARAASVDFHHPGVAAEQKENSAILFKAVNRLPENQKTAFLLQKLEGLGQQEIAEVMDTTVSSVESLLHRARQNLRKTLNEFFENENE
jgi:RNA polymerase sigma-70 factor (ECF subfamily)